MTYKISNQTAFDYKLKKNSTDDKYGVLKFSSCHDKYPLHDLKKEELKAFSKFAILFENMMWREIKIYKGFKFENIPQVEKPDTLGDDIILSSMRITGKFRLIGYRQDEYFYIVWFDRNHKVYDG